jgi:hypothetical protein
MATKTITVYEALEEKKLLEKRLTSGFQKLVYVTAATDAQDTINGINREDIDKRLIGNYTSVKTLIDNYAAITAAINQSNAVTKVTIDGKEYTVADAIARYNTIDIEIDFMNALSSQYSSVLQKVQSNNASVEDPEKMASFISGSLGNSTKATEELLKTVQQLYRENNTLKIIDPNKLGEILEDKTKDVCGFKYKFHTALTCSNTITKITFELED